MRLLFEIDLKNYDINGKGFVRPSARLIHIRNGKIAMVHSLKYNYYKFPGGGIEDNELKTDALIREALEEAGLVVIKDSIKEYGYVHRIQASDHDDADYFLQDNYYYIADCEEEIANQKLDDYEAEESFTLEFVDPEYVIEINRKQPHGPKDLQMIEREARVLELLIEEKYL